MIGLQPLRPVASTVRPSEGSSPSGPRLQAAGEWPEGSLALAERLHRQLSIGDRDWHAFKRQRPRRAAEQLAAALVQLLAADDPASAAATDARQRAIALLDHAQGWLRAEISDAGCPRHGR
ncbi:MAG: hypothetical protein ER33_01405 [Cyanobium sp. CACIAM 14]|nr:MAG: hypothetical protein ER33_01405 [Cyanobium sp. CACIAM 14]